MKLTKLLLFFILIITSFLTYKFSLSYFSDTGQSTDNILSASATFPSPVADHVVISEVQIKGANANQDFVELYNPKNVSVDLNGWQLRVKNSEGTDSSLVLIGSGKSIPAHGFFLWASSKSSGFDTSIGADVSNDNTISENYSIKLEDSSDNPVDQVGWGNSTGNYVEGTPYPNTTGNNNSMERKTYSTSNATSMGSGGDDETKGNGYDSNNNSTDFYKRSVSQPQNSTSPTETP